MVQHTKKSFLELVGALTYGWGFVVLSVIWLMSMRVLFDSTKRLEEQKCLLQAQHCALQQQRVALVERLEAMETSVGMEAVLMEELGVVPYGVKKVLVFLK